MLPSQQDTSKNRNWDIHRVPRHFLKIDHNKIVPSLLHLSPCYYTHATIPTLPFPCYYPHASVCSDWFPPHFSWFGKVLMIMDGSLIAEICGFCSNCHLFIAMLNENPMLMFWWFTFFCFKCMHSCIRKNSKEPIRNKENSELSLVSFCYIHIGTVACIYEKNSVYPQVKMWQQRNSIYLQVKMLQQASMHTIIASHTSPQTIELMPINVPQP